MTTQTAMRVLFWLVGLGLGGTAIEAADPSPYLISRDEFRRDVKVIALMPVEAPAWMELPAAAAARIDRAIANRLTKEKYALLPATTYARIQEKMLSHIDDPTDARQRSAATEHSLRELLLRHRFDAFLQPRVVRVDAAYESDRSEWDGTKQSVKHKGGGKFSGKVAASSIEITIADRSQRPLFRGYGGIEVLMHRVDKQLIPLPSSDLFQDDKRIDKAVTIALDEL
jgi:hypothetical protein